MSNSTATPSTATPSTENKGTTNKQTLSEEEYKILKDYANIHHAGKLTKVEITSLLDKFKATPAEVPTEIQAILRRVEAINEEEIETLIAEIDVLDSRSRYIGYSAAFARAFRYLAFTSDVGEALRPVVRRTIVNASYGIAATYCIADVAWEGYKVHRSGHNDHGHPMTVPQMIVERSTFQLVASLLIPAVIIHTAVDVTKHFTKRINRFTKWGPSIAGLAIIPLLPLYLDEPAEKGIEYVFQNYGPWAEKKKDKHD